MKQHPGLTGAILGASEPGDLFPEQIQALFNMEAHVLTFHGGADGIMRTHAIRAEMTSAKGIEAMEFLARDVRESRNLPEEAKVAAAKTAKKNYLAKLTSVLKELEEGPSES